MRIAHVAPSAERVASGVQTAVEALATALGRRGHDVELWHVGDWAMEPGTALELRASGVRCRRLVARPGRGSLLPSVDVPASAAVDLVHLHSVFVPTNTAIARNWHGPVVLTPHGGYDPVSLHRSFVRKRVYSALFERPMVRRCATAVALTDVEAGQVLAYAGSVPTAVIPNGVAARNPGRGGAWFRREAGVPADARLALFVGRLDVLHKGLDRLVAASAAAPDWCIVLVGPDHRDGLAQLRRMAAELGTANRILSVGQRDSADLTDAYAAADVFVLPSRWEGLPMSLLEALSQGLPALVSPEVDRLVPVSGSGAGWVARSNELGQTLQALTRLPATERSRRKEAARNLAHDYDWNRVAQAHEEVYRAALERSAHRIRPIRRFASR